MKYTDYINILIKERVKPVENCILFGQNINAGSCLGGLTKNIVLKDNSCIINSTNAENSLVGFGFGLMMNGASSVFLMKQLDFLLLGIDHLVNTYNIIRSVKDKYPTGSFTIVATVVDSGYDGPQSSFNNFHDICSIARVNGFNINNKSDADHIFNNEFLQPGFRIIALSQRLGKLEMNNSLPPINIISKGNIFQYSDGIDVTIVSINFSFCQASSLVKYLLENKIAATHFQVNNIINSNWDEVILNVAMTKKIIIIDDSKSIQTATYLLLSHLSGMDIQTKIIIKQELSSDWLYPRSDVFEINAESILNQLSSTSN
jgi:pyruvate/2-oxoglutarate/acetoin dehydrogenase E1 component